MTRAEGWLVAWDDGVGIDCVGMSLSAMTALEMSVLE